MAARGTRGRAEVTNRLTGVLGAAQQNGVGASGGLSRQLIESDALATSLGDASTSSLGESQSADGQSGDLVDARVIGDVADHNSDLLFLALHVTGNTSNRHGGSIDLAHAKPLQDDSIESRGSAASQEAI